MQLRNALVLLLIPIIFYGCSEPIEEHKTTLNVESDFDDVLRDNDGKPWEVQFSTDSILGKMRTKAAEFESRNSLVEYVELKEELNQDFTEIFDMCSMTGEAHNQLHNYLIPLRNRIRKINDTLNDSNPQHLSEIRRYLSEFDKYFEL